MIEEVLAGDTARAAGALHVLRPQFADETALVRFVDERLRPEGYRLVGLFEQPAAAVAVAGFRIGHTLSWGHFLYVDDLSTLPAARHRGYGRRLLDWLVEEARRAGCEQLHLDSAVGPDRADAHRLYLNAGLRITAHHFARVLTVERG